MPTWFWGGDVKHACLCVRFISFLFFVLFWWKSWGEIDVGLKWCQIRELRKNFSCLLPCFTSWIGVVLIWLSVLNFLAIGMWIIVSSLVKHLFTHVLICLWIQKQVFYLCFHDSDDFQLKICFLIDFWMRWCYHCFLLIKKSHVLAWKSALILKIIVECWYVIFRGLKNASLVHKNANMKCKVTIQGLREKGVRLLVDKDPHSQFVELPFSKLRIS